MKKFLSVLLVLGLSGVAKAQLSTDSLEYRQRPDSLRSGELYIGINNFNFLRNYEYFNRFQDGYTLFGSQLEPQLIYYPNKRLSISAGIHIRKDFGGRGIYRSFPLFSIKYQKGNTTLINGVLEGSVHHRMIELLYDLEKRITEPVEYGTQLVVQKPDLFLDAFINWKRMIYKPAPQQEQILGGLSAQFRLVGNQNFSVSVPLQLTAYHQGGQIDTIHEPLQTLVNQAVGVKLQSNFTGFIKAIRAENYFTSFHDLSFTSVQPYQNGMGWFLNAGVDSRAGTLMMSYWEGDGYIAANGMPLYQSVSQHINYPGYTQKYRQLLMLRYSFQKQLVSNLYIDFRLEPFIDLKREGRRRIEFSNTTFLVYKQELRFYKPKK